LYQLSNDTCIAMGGGGGFGFILKKDFDSIESYPCETYGNKKSIDNTKTHKFATAESGSASSSSTSSHVYNVELWKFQIGDEE
jgi:hypothetical protein